MAVQTRRLRSASPPRVATAYAGHWQQRLAVSVLELAIAEHEDAVEIAGEARLMQNPNYAPASELLVQSLDHPRLRLPSEARARDYSCRRRGIG